MFFRNSDSPVTAPYDSLKSESKNVPANSAVKIPINFIRIITIISFTQDSNELGKDKYGKMEKIERWRKTKYYVSFYHFPTLSLSSFSFHIFTINELNIILPIASTKSK